MQSLLKKFVPIRAFVWRRMKAWIVSSCTCVFAPSLAEPATISGGEEELERESSGLLSGEVLAKNKLAVNVTNLRLRLDAGHNLAASSGQLDSGRLFGKPFMQTGREAIGKPLTEKNANDSKAAADQCNVVPGKIHISNDLYG